MSNPRPLTEDDLPAIRSLMELHPMASIYRLSELVARCSRSHQPGRVRASRRVFDIP